MNRRILTAASATVQQFRGIKKYPFPVTFENVVFPPDGQLKLPAMPPEPFYDAEKGESKYKTTKRMIEARGVEEIHTELIHRQFGLAAISGGFISSADFKFLHDRINKNLIDKQFAVWRVDPPWLPRTKKAQGTRLGGGKGSIQKYVTPVRANRIILEVGGHITEIEARAFLMYLCERFSFPVEFISEEILQNRRRREAEIKANNTNRYDWDTVIKYNMQNCTRVADGMRGEDALISVPFRYIVYTVAGLPLSALVICILLSLSLHIDEATRTHCGVDNWLPSVSAAVASYSPERYIWRLFIGVHGAPRLILAFAFRNLLLSTPIRSPSTGIWFALLCQLACILNLCENVFLLLLTSISSVEDHEAHKICFIGFQFCATSYMFLSTWLFNYSNRRQVSKLGEKSYQRKLLCCFASVASMLMACYFYYRHNMYCEPGVYTLFALCEYSVIVSNILFHSTAIYDFDGRRFILTNSGLGGDYQQILPMHEQDVTMVTFSCDNCGETVKKNQVDKHMGRCRSYTFACIDCNVYFDRNSYREHIKCVSEDQRYGGKNFVAKENKGEVKQNLWVNQVQAAIEHVKDGSVKGILNRVAEFDNIPRKEAKFINFLQNSMRIRDRNLCVKAWNAIDTEAKRLRAEEEERKKAEQAAKATETAVVAEKSEAKDKAAESEASAEASDSTTANAKPFKWKKAIKRRMRDAEGGEMKLKKLRKAVLADYTEATQQDATDDDEKLQSLFVEKLETAGVVVEGKVVKLAA